MDRDSAINFAAHLVALPLVILWLGLIAWLVARGVNGVIEDGNCGLMDGTYFVFAAHLFVLGWHVNTNTTGGNK